jgi:hypothetical protein
LCDDTQTGIKGFRYKPEWVSNTFAFDIEILAKAKKDKKSIIEIPIRAIVSDKKNCNIIWETFIDSIKIWWRLKW